MSHRVEILEYRQISDGQFAMLGRCCGNDIHRSWHTMASSVVADPEKHRASVDWFCQRIASEHEAALQAENKLKTLVGTSIEAEPQLVPPTQ